MKTVAALSFIGAIVASSASYAQSNTANVNQIAVAGYNSSYVNQAGHTNRATVGQAVGLGANSSGINQNAPWYGSNGATVGQFAFIGVNSSWVRQH